MVSLPIYMDHHATTPTDPRVVDSMQPFFSTKFGNPASRHPAFGWEARDPGDEARVQVSRLVGCDAREIVFTSGATESNNLAIKGCLKSVGRPARIVTVTTEHRAVLDPCRQLENEGVRVTYVRPRKDGLVDVKEIEKALTPETALLSVMAANNEIGVLQPIAELSALARSYSVLFHTDATQAVGKIPFSARTLDVDFVSLSSHKIYGPKGVGALCIRRRKPRIPIKAMLDGGGHENGLRSGTLNVPAIVGFGRAAELCMTEMVEETARIQTLRDDLWRLLSAGLSGLKINGAMERRLPQNLNFSVAGVDGEALLLGLDDVALSSGAACTSTHPEPSHVLLSLGLSERLAVASIRFSLGRWNTAEEVDYVVEKVKRLVCHLREMSQD